jgi:hypothetical protein
MTWRPRVNGGLAALVTIALTVPKAGLTCK